MLSAFIVDDHELFRNELRSLPVWGVKSGFQIIGEASNGEEAVEKLRKHPVDLLITDIRMPFVNGLELLKTVTEEKTSACTILTSQFRDFEYAKQGLASGAFEYLLKPVNSEELLRVLQRAAKYIKERRQEIKKISYADKIMFQNADELFPEEDFGNLVRLINEGNNSAEDVARYLVDEVYSAMQCDITKTAQMMNRVGKRLAEYVQAENKWLSKFLDLQAYRMFDDAVLTNITLLSQKFVGFVKIIISTIIKFGLGVDSGVLIRQTCRTILENIDEALTINELACKLFVNRTYLSQVFKEKTGITLINYMSNAKIERAKILLLSGVNSSEIPNILGYQDVEYFKKRFKDATGFRISDFRKCVYEPGRVGC